MALMDGRLLQTLANDKLSHNLKHGIPQKNIRLKCREMQLPQKTRRHNIPSMPSSGVTSQPQN